MFVLEKSNVIQEGYELIKPGKAHSSMRLFYLTNIITPETARNA